MIVFGLMCIFSFFLLLICAQSSLTILSPSPVLIVFFDQPHLFRGFRLKASAKWLNVNVSSPVIIMPQVSHGCGCFRTAALTVAASPSRPRDTVVGVQVTEVRGRGQVHQVPGGGGLHLGVSGQEGSPWSYASQTHLRWRPGGRRDGSIVNKPEKNSSHPTLGFLIRNL